MSSELAACIKDIVYHGLANGSRRDRVRKRVLNEAEGSRRRAARTVNTMG